MPDLENHWFVERLAYLGRSLLKDTSSSTPKPKAVVGLGVKRRSSANIVRPFVTLLGPVTFLGLKRNCIGN